MAERQKRMDEAVQTPAPVQTPATEDATTIDLTVLMYRLLAKWKIIVITALIGAAIAAVYTLRFVTPKYQATSTIYVVGKSDSIINMADLQVGTQLTNDYIEVFKTWEVQEQVIADLDLPYNYSRMRSMLSITNPTGTRMLNLTVTSTNPEEAAEIANKYADIGRRYIAEHMSTDMPTIMSSALPPANPVSPSKTRNIALGFILGALATSAVIVLRAVLDDKYKSAEDIRKYTGLVTLAVVPLEDSDVDVESKSSKKSRRNK